MPEWDQGYTELEEQTGEGLASGSKRKEDGTSGLINYQLSILCSPILT